MIKLRTICTTVALIACAVLTIAPTNAQKKYDPGASDTEIKIGNIMPYSGPLSSYALIGRTQAAFYLSDRGTDLREIHFAEPTAG